MKRIYAIGLAVAILAASYFAWPDSPKHRAPGRHGTGIIKGPYLQNPTTDGITVCWVSGTVSKGTVTVDGDKTASDEKETIYHRVKLTGLKPYTHYGFKVTCEGESKTGRFVTAPPPGQPFRFAAYGDNRTQANVHRDFVEEI